MRKNYFSKFMAGAAMLLSVSFGLTSCDDILGEWEKPTPAVVVPTVTPQIVSSDANGATLIITNPSDLTGFLRDLQADIEDTAAAGITYKINIYASAFTTTTDPVLVRMIDNADIELNFQNSISTSTPLVIQAATGADDTPASADNKLTITFPNGTSDLNIEVKMPHTEVVFSGSVTFNELTAITATGTLVLEESVKVKTLLWKAGNIIVKGEDAVETLAVETSDNENASLEVMDERVYLNVPFADREYPMWFNIWADEGQLVEEDGHSYISHEYYKPKNIKVIKGSGESLEVSIYSGGDGNEPLQNLTIADGVTIKTWGDLSVENIIGEGSAKISFTSSEYNNGEDLVIYNGRFNKSTKSVKNISFSYEPNTEHSDAENQNIMMNISFSSTIQKSGEANVSFENCAFVANTMFNINTENGYWQWIEGEEGENGHSEWISLAFEDFTGIVSFTGCTIGGTAISSTTDFINSAWGNEGVTLKVQIDGTLYNVEWDDVNGKWVLTAA